MGGAPHHANTMWIAIANAQVLVVTTSTTKAARLAIASAIAPAVEIIPVLAITAIIPTIRARSAKGRHDPIAVLTQPRMDAVNRKRVAVGIARMESASAITLNIATMTRMVQNIARG